MMVRGTVVMDPVPHRTVGHLLPGHDVDLRRRDEDAAADHGDVDLAVSPWEPME
jgi:hypothetical protein